MASDDSARDHGLLQLPDGSSMSLLYLPPEYRSIRHYCPRVGKALVYYMASVMTFGILPLLAHWWPRLYAAAKLCVASTSSDFVATDLVLLEAEASPGTFDLVPLRVSPDGSVSFEYRKNRYLYDKDLREFHRLSASVEQLPVATALSRLSRGWGEDSVATLRETFGSNGMDLGVLPIERVLLQKMLHPFYVFQGVSVVLWLIEMYYTYAILILIMSLASVIYEVATQLINMRKLQALVHNDAVVRVVRDGAVTGVPADALVIGDVVLLDTGLVPADMVLLHGDGTVDESSLTGEAIPVQKQALSDSAVVLGPHLVATKKESVLHAGAGIVRHTPNAKGLVLATGFSTSKGELFRSIVCPKPVQFQIEADTYRFLAGLTVVAVLAGIQNAIDAAAAGVVWWRILVSSLDLITIAVPPALPLILTVGVGFSLGRLQRQRIFCIDAPRINLAGHLDCYCFDKTGTLTTDEMVFDGVDSLRSRPHRRSSDSIEPVHMAPPLLRTGLGVCHSVAWQVDGVTGSPLEREMLDASGHRLVSSSDIQCDATGDLFERLRQFAFDASVQRSSVVVRNKATNALRVYTKGSPEAVAAICVPASLPPTFRSSVDQYARDGYYCLALAYRDIDALPADAQRHTVEADVHLLGLLLFRNPIKDEAFEVIRTLQRAAIDIRIITGDNALTAIHGTVATRTYIGHHDAISVAQTAAASSASGHPPTPFVTSHLERGDVAVGLASAFEALRRSCVAHGGCPRSAADGAAPDRRARNSAANQDLCAHPSGSKDVDHRATHRSRKTCGHVRRRYQRLRCPQGRPRRSRALGRRSVDCGPVYESRQEHSGRRDARAGRAVCAHNLVPCVQVHGHVPRVQVVLTSTLYASMISLGNNQFLLDDMVIVLGLSMLMLQTGPSRVLTRHRPPDTLFARPIVASLGGHVLLYVLCFTLLRLVLVAEPWYCTVDEAKTRARASCFTYVAPDNDGYTRQSYENTVLWLYGHWAFVLLAIAMNIKDPFRQSAWSSNRPFVAYVIAMAFLLVLLTLTSSPTVLSIFELVGVPAVFRWEILGVVVFHGVGAIVWERFATRHRAIDEDAPALTSSPIVV
ncbi:hypothetical protein SPRG_06877 [Saprolegnia parasitica CBS 223.65]|uniref:Cation-transporting ATPase n=1 Tax=Saprolegnia parasitica (strain CBS 223.65) TaxID=695850 RepID=A0A067CA25_SAPPC|nr:hypothetical protein SPRG_06877 [Saprolegnia parasitica CBS 223.65]KDO27609.1 hypothetical protein SPRG_06877 [Saprolegnia parasitica CBS 223.65]|eukprot:XP_012201731.1 hypothetical protein SPRG_06877 [Saprolegnia parasitica CBS 223.65]